MTDHVRTQIRDYVADHVINSLASTSSRVYKARPRTRPIKLSDGMVALVYTNDEDIEPVAGQRGSRRLQRPLDLVIEGYKADTGDVDAALDTFESEVEVAMATATVGANGLLLNGLVKDLYLARVEKEQDEEAEKPTWLIRLTYYCEYHTREGAPTAALP